MILVETFLLYKNVITSKFNLPTFSDILLVNLCISLKDWNYSICLQVGVYFLAAARLFNNKKVLKRCKTEVKATNFIKFKLIKVLTKSLELNYKILQLLF